MRKWVIAGSVGLIIGVIGWAIAASLNVSGGNAAAGDTPVGACTADVLSTGYNVAYDGAEGRFEVDAVTAKLTNQAATDCAGETIQAALRNTSGSGTATSSDTVVAGTLQYGLAVTPTMAVTSAAAAELTIHD